MWVYFDTITERCSEMWLPSLSLPASNLLSAVRRTEGGLFNEPVCSNLPSLTVFPRSNCNTPGCFLAGLLTTTSPSRISFSRLGTPPPMPTIRPILLMENFSAFELPPSLRGCCHILHPVDMQQRFYAAQYFPVCKC